GRTARAVPAGADAAHRDDAVARGRRGGGLRGIPTMHRVTAALASASLLALIAAPGERAAAEEPYPSKPIRFVLPQPAGGAVDLIARALGDRLSYAMRQPVIVENQPGANGGLAAGQGSPAPRPTATPCSWPSTPISWSTQIFIPTSPTIRSAISYRLASSPKFISCSSPVRRSKSTTCRSCWRLRAHTPASSTMPRSGSARRRISAWNC